jgi:ribosome biogenesis ATPase
LRVQSSKLRLEGNFDFAALAKATPGYVGADLSSLTGAAGIVAVKRIFRELSTGSIVLPEIDTETFGPDSITSMSIDTSPDTASNPVEPCPFSSYQGPSTPLASSIIHFLRAHPNPLTEAQLSPLHIRYSDFVQALGHVQPSSKREGFATIPDVCWGDIGALYHIREELQMAIVQPIRRPELFKAIGIDTGCGVLLWGPPGCGKTLLAKAVANESRANFISVKGPELLNKASPTSHVDFSDHPRLTSALHPYTTVCWRKRTRRTTGILSCASVCALRYIFR